MKRIARFVHTHTAAQPLAVVLHGPSRLFLRRVLLALSLITAASIGVAQAAAYQCFVSTKDAGVQQVAVQADSENAAKVAAVQQFGSRSFGLVGVSCSVQEQQAQQTSDVDAVLANNPALRQIAEFQPVWASPQSVLVERVVIDNCPSAIFGAHPGLTGRNRPKCLEVDLHGAPHMYERGYNETRRLYAVLFPNTPRAWRVYEDHVVLSPEAKPCELPYFGPPGLQRPAPSTPRPGPDKGPRTGFQILAEFNSSGEMISGRTPPFDASCAYQRALPASQNANPQAMTPVGSVQSPSQQASQVATPAQIQLEDCTHFKAFLEKLGCEMRNNNRKAAAGGAGK